jgi:hypothetical protein
MKQKERCSLRYKRKKNQHNTWLFLTAQDFGRNDETESCGVASGVSPSYGKLSAFGSSTSSSVPKKIMRVVLVSGQR